MNRYSRFSLLFLVLPVFFLQQTTGQQKDFQFWPSFTLNVEVVKNLKIQVEEELRLRENCTQMSRQINEIGVGYKINKYVRTALMYRIEADWINADTYRWRNGFYADIALKYEPGRFTLGYRLRLHSSKITLNEKQQQWFDGLLHRHKFTVEYNIKGSPLKPFAEGELFAVMAGSQGSSLLAYRAWAGLSYTLNKKHEFALKYGIDQELNIPDPLSSYIIALGYTLNLPMPSVK
jgi:hypothetical protein